MTAHIEEAMFDNDAQPVPPAERELLNPEALAAANINPRTGLATDYLNHFNEAIMLLEMIPDMPDCFELFLEWEPRTYDEHFRASNFKSKELAIAAYHAAELSVRSEFETVVATMTSIILAVGAAMREATQDQTRAKLASQATDWIKPLISIAGGVINGREQEPDDVDYILSHT